MIEVKCNLNTSKVTKEILWQFISIVYVVDIRPGLAEVTGLSIKSGEMEPNCVKNWIPRNKNGNIMNRSFSELDSKVGLSLNAIGYKWQQCTLSR